MRKVTGIESAGAVPGKSDVMNRRRGLLIFTTAVLLVLLVLAGFLIYLNRLNANRIKRFKQSAGDDWRKISTKAQDVDRSLAGVDSPYDLSGVEKIAGEMEKLVIDIDRSLKNQSVPSGYQELSQQQKTAVEALKTYLEKVRELASSEDKNKFLQERGILEGRSRKASSAVSEFLSNADFARVNISNEFYQAAAALSRAWTYQYGGEAEVQAVYDAADAFLHADIKESNMDKIWSMISSTRLTALNRLGLSKEALAAGWRQLWEGKTPVDYQLRKNTIGFSDPNTATIKTVVDIEGSSPSVAEMRLVKEDGVWKIITYPFVGWE
jgi:hypothetical protein